RVPRRESLDDREILGGRQIRERKILARQAAKKRRRQEDREAFACLRLERRCLIEALKTEATSDPRGAGVAGRRDCREAQAAMDGKDRAVVVEDGNRLQGVTIDEPAAEP